MSNITKTLKGLRVQFGMNQEQCAKQLGISVPAYSKIETGITDVNISRLRDISKMFKLPLLQLIVLIEGVGIYKDQLLLDAEMYQEHIKDLNAEIQTLQGKIINIYE